MGWVFLFLAMGNSLFAHFAETLSYSICPCMRMGGELTWEVEETSPFDELILSWNGLRPEKGRWLFSAALYQQGKWSPWLPYAEWAATSQKTFKSSPADSFAETFQDAVFPKSGLCVGFRIKVEALEGADLQKLESLFASLSVLSAHRIVVPPEKLHTIFLQGVPLQSQKVLNHPRALDLCSPTSTSTAVNFLLGEKRVDPALFAEEVRDLEFDIFGNWVLNTAQAFAALNGSHQCHVERLNDFSTLHSYLMQGLPVVVSIKGELSGAPQPYPNGHLLCVMGYHAEEEKVYCIDSAFAESEKCQIGYPLREFLNAWGARRNLTYVFPKNSIKKKG